MIRFSLIIPYHNSTQLDRSDMLHDLFETLPDREDLEILLVDDHSATQFVPARQFTKTRFAQFENSVDRRYAGAARNTGMKNASGDFLVFADSDDLFDIAALEAVMDHIKEQPSSDLFIARCTSFREDGSAGDRHNYMDGILEEFEASGRNDPLVRLHSPVAKFVRKDFVEKHALQYGDTRVANDVLFNVRMISADPRVQMLEQTIYHIRQGNASLTNDPGRDAARTRIRVARQAQDILRAAGRKELRQPIAYSLLRFFKHHPTMVLCELLRSMIRGDRIVSSKKRAIRRLCGLN